MKISARNVLPGTVASVTTGAIITNASVESLGLQVGNSAYAIIKASEVMIGKNLESAKLSARNILHGKVTELQDGAVNSEVGIRLPGGTMLVASITKASVKALELKQGDEVSAVVKASHVLVGV
jgi:molybdate transport system regulatory protein